LAGNGAAVRLEGVVAGYGAITVLNGLSFTAPAGCITTLIGANGAGKSTVFKTIFGLVRAREGKVHIGDEDVTGLAQRALLARGVVYVPQGRNLFPTLSVRHNLELGGITLGSRALLKERIEAVLARFPRIAERADAQASTLSGGEQKQLEIGRALLLEPRVILIDEPSIGLAPKVIADVFALLRALVATGVSVLMVEQNVRSALAVSDHAVALEGGRTAVASPASEMLQNPRIKSLFLGGHVATAGAA
jgi:branched-chain amino acid transport system ATP-binding protein